MLTINTEHDPYVDFSSYKTFNWMPEKSAPRNPLLVKRLKFVVENELEAKGIQPADEPEILISYYGHREDLTSQYQVESTNFWGNYGNLYGGSAYRTFDTVTIKYTEGSLVLDLVDAKTRQLIWQARIEGIVDDADPGRQLEKALKKAFKGFPPSAR
jgi:hypothetical protein